MRLYQQKIRAYAALIYEIFLEIESVVFRRGKGRRYTQKDSLSYYGAPCHDDIKRLDTGGLFYLNNRLTYAKFREVAEAACELLHSEINQCDYNGNTIFDVGCGNLAKVVFLANKS